jgi:hypothetical protein
VRLATSAMLWPDLQTQLRAVSVCRTVANAAGAPANPHGGGTGTVPSAAPLQPLLVPCILDGVVRALAAAADTHYASELLLLVRSIYLASTARQWGAAAKLRELAPGLTAGATAQV